MKSKEKYKVETIEGRICARLYDGDKKTSIYIDFENGEIYDIFEPQFRKELLAAIEHDDNQPF